MNRIQEVIGNHYTSLAHSGKSGRGVKLCTLVGWDRDTAEKVTEMLRMATVEIKE